MIKIICNGCNKEIEHYYITIERTYVLFNSFIPSVKEHYCVDCFTKMMKENKEEEEKND